MPMSDFDTARFSSHAAAVTAMAQRRGWKVPDEHQRFRDIASAAQDIAAEQLTIDQAPAKASDVSRWVDAQAKKRVMHAEQIKVATELAESAEADAIQLVLRE